MKKRKQILFCFPDSLKLEERTWLQKQPELLLLGDFVFSPITWDDEITGTEEEWKRIALRLAEQSEHVEGIVLWAPEQSLLSLAGYLSMSFQELSIPIILFSAPSPAKVTKKVFLQLGLKSVLINAAYLALSDMAEVLVLAGSSIYRPQQCYWEYQNGKKQVVSKEPALASIQFQLQIHAPYHQRSKKRTLLKEVHALSTDIDYLQWYPGLYPLEKVVSPKKISMIQTEEAYWQGKGLQEVREALLEQGKIVIWYSLNNWSKKEPHRQEYFLSHPQEWWAILLTQFAFSLEKEPQKVFRFIEQQSL